MFCVVYEFKINKDLKDQFLTSWSDFTEAIYRLNGSLGSRIHSTENPEIYIAYAQWPSEKVFNNMTHLQSYSSEEQLARKNMSEATLEIKILHKLNVVSDQLREVKES